MSLVQLKVLMLLHFSARDLHSSVEIEIQIVGNDLLPIHFGTGIILDITISC